MLAILSRFLFQGLVGLNEDKVSYRVPFATLSSQQISKNLMIRVPNKLLSIVDPKFHLFHFHNLLRVHAEMQLLLHDRHADVRQGWLLQWGVNGVRQYLHVPILHSIH